MIHRWRFSTAFLAGSAVTMVAAGIAVMAEIGVRPLVAAGGIAGAIAGITSGLAERRRRLMVRDGRSNPDDR